MVPAATETIASPAVLRSITSATAAACTSSSSRERKIAIFAQYAPAKTTPPPAAYQTRMHTGVWRLIHAKGTVAWRRTACPSTAADSIGLFGDVINS